MRVAYFDLGFSHEQYGLQPTRYGGGAVAARYLKEDPEVDFHVFAPEEAFDNVGPTERVDRCVGMSSEMCQAFQRGLALDRVFCGDRFASFDLILHPHTCATLNRGALKGPIVHFCGFDGSAGHPGNDYVLLYDPSFRAQFGERAKYVRIGKPVPPTFAPSTKEPFVFQCSRHDDHMNSIEVAKQCLQYGIKGVFAGPIHGTYPLMDYIDGVTTVYLGEIDEATKLDYYRRARLVALCHAWPTMPFNQSIIEAQGQGTPIWANRSGPFLTTYLYPEVNGFDSNERTLREAFDLAPVIDQHRCWQHARAYDTSVMVASFKQAFNEIVAEWRVRP